MFFDLARYFQKHPAVSTLLIKKHLSAKKKAAQHFEKLVTQLLVLKINWSGMVNRQQREVEEVNEGRLKEDTDFFDTRIAGQFPKCFVI